MTEPSVAESLSGIPLDSVDARLFEKVHQWRRQHHDEWAPSTIATLVATQGIDFATAVLFDQISQSTQNAVLIRSICKLLTHDNQDDRTKLDRQHVLVAVVPGAFYREYPKTGAGGELLLQQAEALGFATSQIPIRSTGTPSENARLLTQWLQQRTESHIIVASLSKGGLDVRQAIADVESRCAFESVRLWINVGGILNGAPMADWILQRRVVRWWYRLLAKVLGHDYELLQSIAIASHAQSADTRPMSDSFETLHVYGFPRRDHMSSNRAKRWHRRLEEMGPNDGVALLSTLLNSNDLVLPIWGTDHYLQSRWNAPRLIRAVLLYAWQGIDSRDS